MSAALEVVAPVEMARVNTLAALVITKSEEEKGAIDGLAFVQSVKRNLERARKEMVEPLNGKVKEINASFKALLDPVETAEGKVKAALLDWRRRESARIEAEQRRVREENERAQREAQEAERKERERIEAETKAEAERVGFKPEEAAELAQLTAAEVAPVVPVRQVAPSAPLTTVRATVGAVTVRKVWAFEVRSPAEVPRAYLVVDETAIRAAVRAGVREIPGVVIFEREEIAGRGA